MTLEEVLDVMKKAEQSGKTTVRLHTETQTFMVRFVSRWML